MTTSLRSDPQFAHLWPLIDRRPEGGCWLWIGPVSSAGYPIMAYDGRQRLILRVFYETINGPLSPRVQLRRRCDDRRCVNPEHVRLGTEPKHDADRFWVLVDQCGSEQGCWLWTGKMRDGQPLFLRERVPVSARRIAYELQSGRTLQGKGNALVTTCGNEQCVSPAHLAFKQAEPLEAAKERFWTFVDRSSGETGCWMWRGPMHADGEARFFAQGRWEPTHRLAYRWAKGDLPGRKRLRWTCGNERCVRREAVDEIVLRGETRRDRTGCSISRTLGG